MNAFLRFLKHFTSWSVGYLQSTVGAATITHGGTLPDSAGKSDFNALIDNATISGIVGTELAKITTAGKLGGAAFIELPNIPVGAGEIPAANLPASTSSADDMISRGFEIADVTNDDLTIVVQAGVLNHGSTKISKTANTTLTLATANDWWDGATDTYAGGAGWCYIGIDISGNVKLLGANPPDKADTSGNTAGTFYYWFDTSLYWRVIGAVKIDTDDKAHAQGHFQRGSKIMVDVPSLVTDTSSAGTWSGATSCAAFIPAISTMGAFGLYITHASGGEGLGIWIRPNGTTWAINIANGIGLDAATDMDYISGQRQCATDGSQQIQYYNSNNSGGAETPNVYVEGYELDIR